MAEPSVNPNALGAPAEGFGQTVSFAFDPRGTEPPKQQVITSNGPRVSVQGGGHDTGGVNPNSAYTPEQATDPTAALLMKVGGDMLGAKIDEARSQQYVQGMQQAMSGKGIQEVKDSVPWYANLMGDVPLVEGARAYTAQDAVNRTIAVQAANMHQIAKLGPKEAAQHFNDTIKASLTGDSQTDAVIMKGMGEQLPSLMKAQAKANYGYMQAQAISTMSKSVASGAGSLQQYGQAVASDTMTKEDFKVVSDKFIASVMPPSGMDEESYKKMMTSNMIDMANRGEFHAIEALRSTGIASALTPEQGTRVEAAVLAAAKKHRDSYAFQYVDVMAEIESDAKHPPSGSTPRDIANRIDKANAAFKKLTGNPEGLWTSDQKKDMLEGTLNAYKAEAQRVAVQSATLSSKAATDAAKAAAVAEQTEWIRNQVSIGKAKVAKATPGIKGEDVDYQMLLMSQEIPRDTPKMLRLNWVEGGVNSLIADNLQAPVRAAIGQPSPPDAFFQSVNTYRHLEQVGGTPFANAYFGDQARAMAYASRTMGDTANPVTSAAAWDRITNNNLPTSEKLPKKDQEAMVKKVISEGRSWLPKWAGGSALTSSSALALSDEVADSVAAWRGTPGMSDEEATAMALSEVLGPKTANGRQGGRGGEIIGGHYIRHAPGVSIEPLSDLMNGKGVNRVNVPEDLKGDIFDEFLHDKVLLPKDVGMTKWDRLPDAAGNPIFVVSYLDKDGAPGVRRFTGDALAQFAATATKWKRQGNVYTRAATPEEDAAYNAYQKEAAATPVKPIQLTFGPVPTYDARNPASMGMYGGNARAAAAAKAESNKLKTK